MGWVNPRAIAWARNQTAGHRTLKLVLLTLASYCAQDDGCQVSIENLAQDCELDERTVQRALRALVERKFVEIRERSRDGLSRPNEYRLTMSDGKGGSAPPQGGNERIATPAADTNRGGASATLEALKATAIIKALPRPPTATTREDGGLLLFSALIPHSFSVAAVDALSVLPSKLRQHVADEWMARIRHRVSRNPLQDLRTLIELARAGTFVPEWAGEEAALRAAALSAHAADHPPANANARPPAASGSDADIVPNATHGAHADETERIVRNVAQKPHHFALIALGSSTDGS